MRSIIIKGAEKLGIDISEYQISLFVSFYNEINKWGKKINITALLGDKENLIEELFLDSIAPLKTIMESGVKNLSLLDIGSGGGFPGIPLNIVNPSISVTLSDSIEKKVFFMRSVIRTLSLDNIVAAHVKYGHGGAAGLDKAAYDIAISKAVASIDKLGEWALPHLKRDGRLICMKGPTEEAIRLSGYNSPESSYYTLPRSGKKRRLIVYKKT